MKIYIKKLFWSYPMVTSNYGNHNFLWLPLKNLDSFFMRGRNQNMHTCHSDAKETQKQFL